MFLPGTAGALHKRTQRLVHLLRRGNPRLGSCKQDDVITRNGKSAAAGGLAHHTLRSVAHDGTTESLSTNEGDPSGVAFANRFTYGHSNQRVIETTPLTEHMLEILPRLNSLHARCVYRC